MKWPVRVAVTIFSPCLFPTSFLPHLRLPSVCLCLWVCFKQNTCIFFCLMLLFIPLLCTVPSASFRSAPPDLLCVSPPYFQIIHPHCLPSSLSMSQSIVVNKYLCILSPAFSLKLAWLKCMTDFNASFKEKLLILFQNLIKFYFFLYCSKSIKWEQWGKKCVLKLS